MKAIENNNKKIFLVYSFYPCFLYLLVHAIINDLQLLTNNYTRINHPQSYKSWSSIM